MPNVNEMKQSKFLAKGDVKTEAGNGILLTINGCVQENVAMPDAGEELKWCLTFEEVEKPFVLNSTNAQIAAAFLGSEDTDDWIGKKIVLYVDPTIAYRGKVIGGIRVRAPKAQAKPAAAKAVTKPAPVKTVSRQAPQPEPEAAEQDDRVPEEEMDSPF